ncbi:MAG: hypothetical protein IKH30_00745 [Clostridia bacterium]|nr:hypothetical protein [Clostridia bacterium]
MNRRIAIFGILLGIIFTFIAPLALADGYPPYEMSLTYIPKWGKGNFIAGEVYTEGWKVGYNGLCVKAFLQVEGSGEWWPKPTAEMPYVPVRDGKFGITFNTGGDDIHATRIALMLVRARDARLLDYELANAAALCVVTIDREPTGEITINHSYRAEYVDTSTYGFRDGINIGFYTQPGTAPGDPLSEAHIEAVLRCAAAFTCEVRFYSTTGEIAKAYPIARAMGLRVAATAWLDGGENDQAELDALISLCNLGFAGTAIVGNETQYAKRISEETLLEDIAYVRAGILDKNIPVTTADNLDAFLNSPRLRDACDVLSVNVYPYWSGMSAEDDLEAALAGALNQLAACVDEKPIILTETGWPSDGSYRAGIEGQRRNLNAAWNMSWASDAKVVREYWFSLADEPWKEADETGVGAYWGLLDKDLNIKPIMYETVWQNYNGDDYVTDLDIEDVLIYAPFNYRQPNDYDVQ